MDPRAERLVLMLGDQPGVTPETVAVAACRGGAPIAVCRYADGRGHPLATRRWKLLDRRAESAAEIRVDGAVPRDVDTWDDYRKLRA